ncbi:MAG: RnfABCDGE type electron transport complex subunit B [Oscillospiraceae bacterium]|nr:RnfABCDGE type electron transport complex subunit B [Oscillospiraceae bacterium]
MTTILLSIAVLGVLGAVFAALLGVASIVFHVEVDPKQEEVRACLAGANCGGCGYPGCDGYAAAVAKGEAPTNKCVAGGAEAAAKIAAIMGAADTGVEKMVAFVPCSGTTGHAEMRFNYSGPIDCRAAMIFGGKSNKTCTFACIGLGNCTRVCQFDAIHIVDGVAKVNRNRCVGCGMCADACPKSIIKLIPESQKVMPACNNHDKGAKVMKMCDFGCIGCMKCQRECEAGAIKVVDFLAQVDPEKCIGCGHCAEVCPRKIITMFGKKPVVQTTEQ